MLDRSGWSTSRRFARRHRHGRRPVPGLIVSFAEMFAQHRRQRAGDRRSSTRSSPLRRHLATPGTVVVRAMRAGVGPGAWMTTPATSSTTRRPKPAPASTPCRRLRRLDLAPPRRPRPDRRVGAAGGRRRRAVGAALARRTRRAEPAGRGDRPRRVVDGRAARLRPCSRPTSPPTRRRRRVRPRPRPSGAHPRPTPRRGAAANGRRVADRRVARRRGLRRVGATTSLPRRRRRTRRTAPTACARASSSCSSSAASTSRSAARCAAGCLGLGLADVGAEAYAPLAVPATRALEIANTLQVPRRACGRSARRRRRSPPRRARRRPPSTSPPRRS